MKMTERITVSRPGGLNMLAATELVSVARGFTCSVTVRSGLDFVNGKSALDLLSLGAGEGQALEMNLEGEDAMGAWAAIEGLFEGAAREAEA